MPHRAARNPLHGITLEQIVTELAASVGWEKMGEAIDIRCFKFDPSVTSSLQFLRRTPWARKKVEELYLKSGRNGPSAPLPGSPSPDIRSYDRSALKAHELNRSRAQFKSDNRSKV